ncbi:hypothetical protein [Flavobacterium sp. ZS1P14]|uniref:hypothetical protein n=1 Tax=Flavobacterium sp. ZS1P14 TaxID=3401729 RepID=UPI003AABAE4F
MDYLENGTTYLISFNSQQNITLNLNLMEINWFILSIVFIGAIVLIVILIKQNWKDEKKIEKELNYFKKPDEVELNDEKDM